MNLVDPFGLWTDEVDGPVVWGCRASTGMCGRCAYVDIICTNDPYEWDRILSAIGNGLSDLWSNGTIATTIELYQARGCTPVRETFTERALGVGQVLADLTTIGSLATGHPEVALWSNRASMGFQGAQLAIDIQQRDRAGAISAAAGMAAGSVPMVRQTGTGPAALDFGRRLDGTFTPNSAGRRQAAEAAQTAAQGAAGAQVAQNLCPPR